MTGDSTEVADFRESLLQAVLHVPLAQHLGCELVDPAHPELGVRWTVGQEADNLVGGAHAAATYAVAEMAAFVLVIGTLEPGEHAVTVASACQLIAAAPIGATVQARPTLVRRGRRTAHLNVDVVLMDAGPADGAPVEKVVAAFQLTKAILTRT